MAAETKIAEDKSKAPKHRSPAYPAISLGQALERAKQFYAVQKQHAAPVESAVGIWGFAAKSSGGSQTIAALKQFGLMRESDQGGTREVQLSELALRIVRDEREPSPERDEAIRKAALLPKIYSEMWAKWDADYPADATMRFFLVHDKKYNEGSVSDLIASYKDTVKFAKLSESDKESETEDESRESGGQGEVAPLPPPSGAKLMEGERVVFTHEIEPSHGVRIVASGNVDSDVLDALELYLKLQKKRLGLDPQKPSLDKAKE
jgi:hypothetical protein